MRKGLSVALLAAVAVVPACGSGHEKSEAKPAPRKPVVVLLIMDEFPTDALYAADGRTIDAARFPNFAALARMATWFPNSMSVYDSTPKAVPLILDGMRPFKGETADTRDHAHSLYTAFGRRGYKITDSEEATAVCPRRYCPGARKRRPAIIPHLVRGRAERLDHWVNSIRPLRRPGLWVKHALLPHQPWIYLPSGKLMRPGVTDPVPGMAAPPGFYDVFLMQHNRQRQLLQIGFADRELGKVLRRLRQQRMLDRALIVVTADHGYEWKVGVARRRQVFPRNIDELAPQPMFVKAPGQRRGRVDRAYVRSLDVAPTIADVMNIRLGYRADGHSAFSPITRRRHVVAMPKRDFSYIVRISARNMERRRADNRRRWRKLFATGAESMARYGDPWASVYRIGPNQDLLGRRVADLHPGVQGRLRAELAYAAELRAVNPSSSLLPTQIGGFIRGGGPGARRDVAVAVNGRIEAVGRSFHLKGRPGEGFGMMVPEKALRPGRNDVSVFAVAPGQRLTLLGHN
jgi:Sulfatase